MPGLKLMPLRKRIIEEDNNDMGCLPVISTWDVSVIMI